jgi:endonuclease/exonuclease/phosphatase family metal-dependent hydrolase
VRIVSVNAWGGAMFDALAAWLGQAGADIACLQEVTRVPGAGGWTRFDDGERVLPQRANLFDDVRGLLPAQQAVFVASDAGPVRDASGETHRQDFGLATLVAEHLPLVGVHTAFVHGSFVDHHEWAIEDRPRVAVGVRVLDRARGRGVTVVQCHGLRDPSGKQDSPARLAQAKRLAELVVRSREEGDLTVVCGDLNLLPDSETFDVFADLGLVDLVGESDTRTSRYRGRVRHASYLLVSDPTAIAGFSILAEPEISDHRALLLDI